MTMANEFLKDKAPKDWTHGDIQGIVPAEHFCVERLAGSVLEYHVYYAAGEQAVDVRFAPDGWRFTLDRGRSWFFFDTFDDLPPAVQEFWRARCAELGVDDGVPEPSPGHAHQPPCPRCHEALCPHCGRGYAEAGLHWHGPPGVHHQVTPWWTE